MIPHDGPKPGFRLKNAGAYLSLILAAMGVPAIGFRPRPDLGHYKTCDPIPRVPKPAPFEVAVRYRGGKRVDPRAELRRLRSA